MSPPTNATRNDGIGGPVLKKGPWTAAEDAVLVEYVNNNGEGNWNAVQKNTGLARCGKSCRLRWTNHLRPNLKKGSFTPEEEKLIVELHSQLGNKWARMAAQLPGRTDNEIKNYWNTRIKRRIRQGLPLYPNDVTPQQGGGEQKQPAEHQTATVGTSQEKLPTTTGFHLETPVPFQAINKRKASTLSPFHLPIPLIIPSHSHQQFKTTSFNGSMSLFDTPAPLHSPTSCLTIPQTPPALGSSVRYRPYETPGFSLPFPAMSQSSQILSPRAPTGSSQLPNLGVGMGSCFQFSSLPFNFDSPRSMKPQVEQMLPSSSVYSIRSELPSSQFHLPQIGNADTSMEKKPRVDRSDSGLLEDLLEEVHGLASGENLRKQNLENLQDKKLDASSTSIPEWDASNSINSSTGPMNSMQENLSKLLDSIPSAIPVSVGSNANGEILNGQSSNNGSGLSDVGIGLEAHHIAALFPMDHIAENGRISGSYSWDNLPGIC